MSGEGHSGAEMSDRGRLTHSPAARCQGAPPLMVLSARKDSLALLGAVAGFGLRDRSLHSGMITAYPRNPTQYG